MLSEHNEINRRYRWRRQLVRRLGRIGGALVALCLLAPGTARCANEARADAAMSAAAATAESAMDNMLPGQSRTVLPNGQWLLLGGWRQDAVVAGAAVYDPAAKRMTTLDVGLAVPRADHTATLMADGTVPVLGGRNEAGDIVRTAESYDPADKGFTTLSIPALLPRAGHRATVLADGRLLITGGVDTEGHVLYDAEVLNPYSGEVERVDVKAEQARFEHLVALLPAHTVLVWGGYGEDHQPAATAELFDPETLSFTPYSEAAAKRGIAALTDGKLPQLLDSEPADAVADVGVGQVIAVRFSKAMDVTTLNADTVTLLGVNGLVAAKVTPVENGLVLFVWPKGQLLPESSYSLMIKGAKDVGGRALAFTAVGFKTAAIDADTTTASPAAAGLAAANLGNNAGLAINSRTADGDTAAATIAETQNAANSEEAWVPQIAHFKGSWTSGREFVHSRDYARKQARRQAFLDSLSPRAREKLRQHWQEKGVLPDTTVVGKTGRPSAMKKASVTEAGAGTLGSISGQVLRLDGKPLAGVVLTMAGQRAVTDTSGEFLLENAPLGSQVLAIDGRPAGRDGSTYGRFDYHMIVEPGLNDLDFTIWMPKLDTRHAVRIPSPTTSEVVVTNPDLPGLELRIPPGSIIRDVDGKIVNEISITPVPLDQTPFPMPYREVPMFYTIQPGGATLQSVNAKASPGARLVYPNYTHQPAGARLQLFDYDPKGRGWYIYTLGTVSADGNSIKPDQPFVIYQFTATSAASPGGTPPSDANPPCENDCTCSGGGGGGAGGGPAVGGGGTAGDPVACREGLFVESHVDLSLADTRPLSLRRVYRQNDANQRAFGVGASHGLDVYLYYVNQQSSYSVDSIDLVQADGSRVRFLPEVGANNYQYSQLVAHDPGAFYMAAMKKQASSSGNEFVVTRKDGMRYGFSYYVSRLKWIEDRDGNRTSLFRDNAGRIDIVVSPNGRWIDFEYGDTTCTSCITQATDNAGRTVSYQYDSLGRLVKVTDAENGITNYTYDSVHRMTTVKDPLGQTTGKYKVTNTYDASGRVKQQTYADGSTTRFAYTVDKDGNVTQTDVTRERGDVRRITYNADGYMLSDTYALGKPEQQRFTYVRSPDNLVIDVIDPLGRTTHYDYNNLGNVVKVTQLYGTPQAVSWAYTYDTVFPNQVARQTDPLGHRTTVTYDSGGHLVRVTNALGQRTDMTYDGLGQVVGLTRHADDTALAITFAYNGGDLVSIKDPLGRVTKLQTDAVGRTVAVTDPLGHTSYRAYDKLDRLTAVTDALGNAVRYSYDPNGNLTDFTDAKGHVIHWTYDARNRPVSRRDALGKAEHYRYDAAGNLIFVTDRKGQVSGFRYDALNRRIQAGFGAASTTSPVYQNTIAYTWDAGNRLTQIDDSIAGTITRSYDDRFDTVKEEVTPEGTVTYTYFGNGLRRTMTPSGGTTVTYAYDAANHLLLIRQAAGKGKAQPPYAHWIGFDYDSAGRRLHTYYPFGMVSHVSWDKASQLTSLRYLDVFENTLGSYQYAYDPAGRRTGMDGVAATTELPAAADARYDAANRIASWNGSAYRYDAAGNLISDGKRTYTWNSRNQLVAIHGAVTASFAYDGLGRRRAKTVNGVTTRYLYDGGNAIQEQRNGVVTANLLAGPGLDEWYARSEGGETLYYLKDGLGSTRALVDRTAKKVASYSYGPYGRTKTIGDAKTNAYAYTGREKDGTGLYYYRARYYHPETGRFISEDPIGLAGGLNLYRYVNGNPTSKTDPLGLDPWWNDPSLNRPIQQPSTGTNDEPPNSQCVMTGVCIGVVIGGTLGKAPGALVGAVVFGGIGTQVCPSGNSQWPPPAPLGGGDDPTSIFQ